MKHRPLRFSSLDHDALCAAVVETWALTDWLFSGVHDDAMHLNPDPLRNPLVFYVGHPAAFWVNKLRLAGLTDRRVDPHLERILAIGVDPAHITDLDLSTLYPPIDEVRDFRRQALDLVLQVCRDTPLDIAWDTPAWALPMGLEHERIHVETSSVLIRQLDLEHVEPPSGWAHAPAGEASENRRVRLEGGPVRLGKTCTDTYGWDNEYGELTVQVDPFEASTQLVSNAEFQRFVDRGYTDDRWWCDAGRAWRADRTAPSFWRGHRLRTTFQQIERPEAWPAEVIGYEAQAYARWAGARLPTEAEHRHLAHDVAPEPHVAFAACSPRGVAAGAPDARGIHDGWGNVWQWLDQDHQPLPGFRTHPLYVDYSTPGFGAHHQVLLGGSWATTGASASRDYRQWFRPHFLQHAGFRLAW